MLRRPHPHPWAQRPREPAVLSLSPAEQRALGPAALPPAIEAFGRCGGLTGLGQAGHCFLSGGLRPEGTSIHLAGGAGSALPSGCLAAGTPQPPRCPGSWRPWPDSFRVSVHCHGDPLTGWYCAPAPASAPQTSSLVQTGLGVVPAREGALVAPLAPPARLWRAGCTQLHSSETARELLAGRGLLPCRWIGWGLGFCIIQSRRYCSFRALG